VLERAMIDASNRARIPRVPPSETNMAVVKSELMFPKLNRAEIALLSTLGNERSTNGNEVLFEPGDANVPVFVVLDGRLEIARVFKKGESLVVSHSPGEFSGEVDLLLGGPSAVRGKTKKPSRLLEIKRNDLLHIAATRSLLSEVFLTSYLLRWAYSVSSRTGNPLLVGSNHSAGTLRVRAFLERNARPYTYLNLDCESAVQWLLDQFAVRPEEIPILICRGGMMLRNPSNAMVGASLEVKSSADDSSLFDVEFAVFSPGEK
jgi:thioredoxin reductase (NADPH)